MFTNEERFSQLYELEGCLIVPFHEDMNAGNIPPLRDSVLNMMAKTGSFRVILDMTSVAVINSRTFQMILEMADMVRMMGGEAVFTGIQPGVASVLVDLAVNTERLKTASSINEGISQFRESSRIFGLKDA